MTIDQSTAGQARARVSAKKLYKLVSGILNGAYSKDLVSCHQHDMEVWLPGHDITFDNACNALARANEAGYVPIQGLEVLKKLITENPGVSLSHSLRTALSLHTEDQVPAPPALEMFPEEKMESAKTEDEVPALQMSPEDQIESAKRMFKCVAGVLNGAFTVSDCSCKADVAAWVHKSDTNFLALCDALAVALERNLIPEKGLKVLVDLAPQMKAHGLSSDSSLVKKLRVDVSQCDLKASTKRVFKFVTGTIQGKSELEPLVGDLKVILHDDLEGSSDSMFWASCNALARIIEAGLIPEKPLSELVSLVPYFSDYSLHDSRLCNALKPYLCPKCHLAKPAQPVCECRGSGKQHCGNCNGSGKYKQPCRGCNGTGRGRTKPECPVCGGSGMKVLGDCRECKGHGSSACLACCTRPELGKPRTLCSNCFQQASRASRASRGSRVGPPAPVEGITITRARAGDLSRLQNLWSSRGASGTIEAAWQVDNPIRTDRFVKRREELRRLLGREADSLEGFHGTHPDNVMSICQNGFDRGKRGSAVGQVFGSGEYFAKNPNVSIGYCRGGQYMLVCRLSLGKQSFDESNSDGDHIWVPDMSYYVISSPDQILPQFIVKYISDRSIYGLGYSYGPPVGVTNAELERVLESGTYTTKEQGEVVPVPPQRACMMSRDHANVLWVGMMHSHLSDESLTQDTHRFLTRHAADYTDGMRIQIVKGFFKKAHVILSRPMPRDLVHKLNTCEFVEDNKTRTICVEDSHGSPEQDCPKWIAGYCRGQNLRFTHPCWCRHKPRATEEAKYSLRSIDLHGAKGNEIVCNFLASAPFHTGSPKVIGINAIHNPVLARCHEEYRRYLTTKHMEEPAVQELYHGTNNNILDVLYKHGLQPPSDMEPSENCPISGGKGLCTSLCNNSCKHCTKMHRWNKCHMYGLGIYLADMAQKSHRYCSQPRLKNGKQVFRMVICQVLGKSFKLEGHLRDGKAMHDVVNIRACCDEDLDQWIEYCQVCTNTSGVAAENLEVADKSDLLYVKGLGNASRPGFSVVNNEYVAFHPHQCLPKYEIIYEMDDNGWY